MTSVEREQTNKHTNIYTHKHTYRVKTEETFFYGQIFYFLFFFLYLFESKKDGFQKTKWQWFVLSPCYLQKCKYYLFSKCTWWKTHILPIRCINYNRCRPRQMNVAVYYFTLRKFVQVGKFVQKKTKTKQLNY